MISESATLASTSAVGRPRFTVSLANRLVPPIFITCILIGAHLSPLRSTSTHITADPVRTRKLLLKRSELQSLIGSVERRGYTLVPLELYWKAGRAKLAVGLAKGKKQHDKRAVEKDSDWQRDKARILRGR